MIFLKLFPCSSYKRKAALDFKQTKNTKLDIHKTNSSHLKQQKLKQIFENKKKTSFRKNFCVRKSGIPLVLRALTLVLL